MKAVLLLLSGLALPGFAADAWSPIDHGLWQAITETRVKEGKVEYSQLLHDSAELKLYLKNLAELPESQVEALRAAKDKDPKAKAEWLALWINAYNAATVDLILENGIPGSIKDIPKRWDLPVVHVAGRARSLDEIEHKLLRPEGDPRIHFAIVCASKGCPPLASFAFTGKDLDAQLDGRVKAALAGPPWYSLDKDKRVLTTTKIMDWFEDDFIKAYGGKAQFLERFVSPEDKAFIEEHFVQPGRSKRGKFKTFDYDWSLNAG